jgi:DNA-binding NtrC family response regulator
MALSARILIVDDDPTIRLALRDRLASLGHRVSEAASCAQAREVIKTHELELVLLDWQLPDSCGGALLDEITKLGESVEVIVITAFGSIPTAVESVRRGAFDYVSKPFDFTDLEARVDKALECRRLKREAASFRAGLTADLTRRVVATSSHMVACLETAKRLAATETTALILGETGSGKGVLAHVIHTLSPRADKPFVVVSCANFSEHLVDDELFGHERGAFTGATELKRGKVELADGGTLFFDEVGELSRSLQAKLLRFLEERLFTRVGGTKEREADVRMIAATNRDLVQAVQQGAFRDVLPAQRVPHHHPSAPGAPRRYSRSGPMFLLRTRRRTVPEGIRHPARRDGRADETRLARERSRTPERHRARHGAFDRRGAPPGAPPAADLAVYRNRGHRDLP